MTYLGYCFMFINLYVHLYTRSQLTWNQNKYVAWRTHCFFSNEILVHCKSIWRENVLDFHENSVKTSCKIIFLILLILRWNMTCCMFHVITNKVQPFSSGKPMFVWKYGSAVAIKAIWDGVLHSSAHVHTTHSDTYHANSSSRGSVCCMCITTGGRQWWRGEYEGHAVCTEWVTAVHPSSTEAGW